MPNESAQFSAMNFFKSPFLQQGTELTPTNRPGLSAVTGPSDHMFMPTQSRARLPGQTAIDYAKFRSRSRDVVMCVYDETANMIETHEQAA
jgi:hypothetical protein